MNPESNGVKTWQWVVTVLIIIVLIVLGYFMFRGDDNAQNIDVDTTASPTSTLDSNRITVTDQFPGNIVYVSSAQLANPGFVVVQKDNGGTPGASIGSQYFDKGTNPGRVTLTENTMENGLYYAVLYTDTNGDKIFNATTDMPVKDASGNVIMRTFRATSSVTEIKG